MLPNITSGSYTVTVTDANNCQASDSITVNVINIGINENLLDKEFQIYPNPTQGSLNIRVNNASLRFDLQITDVEGRIVRSDIHNNVGLFVKNYDLSDLAKGIYYLRIFSTEGNITRSLLIQ